MSIPDRVDQYLRRHHIVVQEHNHTATYTAAQLAQIEHVPETNVAKVVFFWCNQQLVMGVLPANRNLNLHLAKKATYATSVRLATEREIAERIDNLHLGAIPPFGSLFGLPVLMDEALQDADVIEASGGIHSVSFRMRMADYIREEAPQIVHLSRAPIHHHPHKKTRLMDFF